jgi:hypothetical protein
MLNFPDAPTDGQDFVAPTAKFTWTLAPDRWRRKAMLLPILNALVPDRIPTDTADSVVELQGNNFESTSAVYFDSVLIASTFVSPTSITIVAPLSSVGKIVPVMVSNDGATSNVLNFQYNAPLVPVIDTVQPNPMWGTNGVQTLQVRGRDYEPSSQVHVNGTPHTTTFVDSGLLTAPFDPAGQNGGNYNVTVVTGALTSNTVTFNLSW